MSRKSSPSFGALHPVLFFIVIYGISLFMAIFVCRTVYYGMNETPTEDSDYSAQARDAQSLEGAIAYK